MRRLGLIFVLGVVGCNRAPSCKDAIDKAARTLGDDAAVFVQGMTEECERAGWTAEQRRCLANAQDKAAVAMCALTYAQAKASEEQAAAKQAVQAEIAARKQAQQAMDRAQHKVEKVAKDIADFDSRLRAAESELLGAHSDAERKAGEAKLAALRTEKAELDAQIAAAKAEADSAARVMDGQPAK